MKGASFDQNKFDFRGQDWRIFWPNDLCPKGQTWLQTSNLTIKAKMKTATKPIFQNQNLCNICYGYGLRYVGIKGSAPMVDLSALL